MIEHLPPTVLTVTASFDGVHTNSANEGERAIAVIVSNRNNGISVAIGISIDLGVENRHEEIEIGADAYNIKQPGENDRLLKSYQKVLDYAEDTGYVATPSDVYMRHIPYKDNNGDVRCLMQTDTRIMNFCNAQQPTISLQGLNRWLDSLGIQHDGEHQKQRSKLFGALTGTKIEEAPKTNQYAQWGTWQ